MQIYWQFYSRIMRWIGWSLDSGHKPIGSQLPDGILSEKQYVFLSNLYLSCAAHSTSLFFPCILDENSHPLSPVVAHDWKGLVLWWIISRRDQFGEQYHVLTLSHVNIEKASYSFIEGFYILSYFNRYPVIYSWNIK